MISTFFKAKAKQNLSNRAAANIIENLKEIETSNIYLRFMGAQVNAKSLVGLLTLDIKQNECFEIYIFSTDDVAAAAIDLEKLLRAIEPYCEMILVD